LVGGRRGKGGRDEGRDGRDGVTCTASWSRRCWGRGGVCGREEKRFADRGRTPYYAAGQLVVGSEFGGVGKTGGRAGAVTATSPPSFLPGEPVGRPGSVGKEGRGSRAGRPPVVRLGRPGEGARPVEVEVRGREGRGRPGRQPASCSTALRGGGETRRSARPWRSTPVGQLVGRVFRERGKGRGGWGRPRP